MTDTRKPMPGDAVRIAPDAVWQWGSWDKHIADRSAVGIIQGRIGDTPDGASIIFNHSTYRSATAVSSSGGPGTIYTDFAELRPTDDTVSVNVWRFRDGLLQAHNAEHYTVTVPVWEWRPAHD